MAASFTIVPDSQTLTLASATHQEGQSLTVYSDSGTTTSVTLPATVTTQTTYYLKSSFAKPGRYADVVVKNAAGTALGQNGSFRVSLADGSAVAFTPSPTLDQTVAADSSTFGLATTPTPTANVVQGLYARTVPAPSGEASITALCVDPNNAGYLWALGNTSTKIGYTADNGATFHATTVGNPGSPQTIVQALITTNFMWLLTAGTTSKSGQLWRSPAPNATGSNLAFTKIFDLTGLVNGPGGGAASGPSNSSFRVGCLAVQPDESAVYLLTYAAGNDSLGLGGGTDGIMAAGSDVLYSPGGGGGVFSGFTQGATITVAGAGASGGLLTSTVADVFSNKKVRLVDCAQTAVAAATFTLPTQTFGSQAVIGGPFFYVSTNANGAAGSITFANTKFWSFAKHGHAVQIIGGVPWVALGDYPFPGSPDSPQPPITHVGMWAATSAAGSSWTQITSASVMEPYDCINFLPVTINGQTMIVAEADNRFGTGPIIVPTQSGSKLVNPLASMRLPYTTVQTMRSLTLTSEGNLMWYGTGESGAVGPTDGIWISKTPFDRAFLLESLALNAIAAPNQGIEQGAYLWIYNTRITKEKFIGQ